MLSNLLDYPNLSDPDYITTEQTLATRALSNKNDGNKDAAAKVIASNVLRSLVTAVTKAMKTAIANATVLVAVTPKTITYSSSIHLYDNKPFKIKTKEGK